MHGACCVVASDGYNLHFRRQAGVLCNMGQDGAKGCARLNYGAEYLFGEVEA